MGTTWGRLIFELGGLPERELEKLKAEAERLGKGSFAFAFYMDRQKEERERGVTIACTTKEFYTEKWHYTIIDAPGHRDFIKNMITGASQADVALIVVPADGNFTTAIAKGNHKAGEIQGQTRQHSRLINLLGVKQICIGVNKMDCDTAGYKQERYDEISNEMKSMLIKVGWKKDFIEKNTPVLPISGWMGDNLLKKSENMPWWKGTKVFVETTEFHVDTLYDVLDKVCKVPSRPLSAAMRMPISGIYKIKGVGDVLWACGTGCCEARRRSHLLANAHGFESVHWESVHCGDASSTSGPGWPRRGSSTRRFRCWTSLMRSRWVTHPLGSCDAAVQLAAFQPSSGRWERKLAVKSWRTPIRSNPTRWPSAASSPSSLLCATPSKIARVCPVWRSWMGMVA